MLKMSISLLLLIGAMDVPLAAQSDVDGRLQIAKQILDVSFTSATYDIIQKTLVDGSREQLSSELTRSQLADVVKRQPTAEDVRKLNDPVRATMAKVFSREAFVDALAPLYAKYLTLDDLTNIATFMNTPHGQRLLQIQGRLMAEGSNVVAQMMEKRMGTFQETLVEELRKVFPDAR